MRLLSLSFRLLRSSLLLSTTAALHAALIGVSKPAESLTTERIQALVPAAQRYAWLDYLRRSQQLSAKDHAGLDAERKGLSTIPPLPGESFSARTMPLHREAAFYAGAEAKRIGDAVISFQTPAGGWSKNLDMAGASRQRGQSYAGLNAAPTKSDAADFDHPADEHWHYIATIDNDATNTELHFLAELSAALPGRDGDTYRAAAVRGLEYLISAQYPNGGWPQVYPLEGGYHDAITFNDDAQIETTEVLAAAAKGARLSSEPEAVDPGMVEVMERMGRKLPEQHAATEDWTFVAASMRSRAAVTVAKSLSLILRTQVMEPDASGKHLVATVWGQQYDPLTLQPCSARNYEMASLSSGESAGIMNYLMSMDRPSAAAVGAVDAAAAWFEAHAITGYAWVGGRNTAGGRHLEAKEGAGPLWSRYYALDTQKPIFGDRDKTIHDDVNDISLERRNGYSWYGTGPARALKQYAEWKKAHKAGR